MAKRYVMAVIGCGNIGSRHLQGLTFFGHAADIHAVDPMPASLDLARQRVCEMPPTPDMTWHYHAGIEGLPRRLDLVVIATGSAPRRRIVENLLEAREVGALVLEKFLFQSRADYAAVGALLATKGIAAYVNTPRRAWPAYAALRKTTMKEGELRIHVELNRTNGLATNAIHFIDLAAYLCGEAFSLDGRGLHAVEGVSRHAGMLEFGGFLHGSSPRGDRLSLSGRTGSTAPHVIVITSDKRRILLHEAAGKAFIATAESQWAPVESPFPVLRQSELTGGVAADILLKSVSALPSYAESAKLHLSCLEAFLEAQGRPRDDEAPVAIS